MDWTIFLAVGGAFAGLLALKRLSFVPVKAAREHLAAGGVVIDVRSPGEFASGHLKQAMNIPLGDLPEVAEKRLPKKDQPVLLHCLSGARSGMARRRLQKMGYTRVFNLGSYRRAAKVLER
jgi:phage shock protein E